MIKVEGLTRWFDGTLAIAGHKVGEEDTEIR